MPAGDVPAQQPAAAEQDVPAQQVAAAVAGTAGWASCAACGATTRTLTASLQLDERGATWLCDLCTRRHLRSSEGGLDEVWW